MDNNSGEVLLESLAPEIPMLWEEGTFHGRGDIFLVKDKNRPSDLRFIVKRISVTQAKKDRHKNLTELEACKYFHHKRIVPFHGYRQHGDELSMFMTYMKKGSLVQYIESSGILNEEKIRIFTRQILEGVSYLHTRKTPIIHRDIKAKNILLEDESNIRLTGFGVSKIIKENTQARTCEGTYNWMAPEVINAKTDDTNYCTKADIWSVGCTVYEMATKEPPFHKLCDVEIIRTVGEKEKCPDFNRPEITSQALKILFEKTFKVNTMERPSAKELLDDDFFVENQIPIQIPKNIVKGQLIGKGTFGHVYSVQNSEDKFVVKEFYIDAGRRETIMDLFRKEAQVFMNINHERIVPFYGYCESRNVLSFYMGYMKMGSLAEYIKKNHPMAEEKVKKFGRQILEGADYLHEKGILHKDITGKHVLMENEFSVKLGCVSISKTLRTNSITKAMLTLDSLDGCVRTVNWMAPETINGIVGNKQFDSKADIWSVGCVVVEMVTGVPPSLTLKSCKYTLEIKNPEQPLDYSLPDCSSTSLREFLIKTFELDPSRRPSSKELLETDSFLN